jgi:adenosine kinase
MTITVIGQVTRDTLIFPHQNWRVVESLGGSLYTASALASLTNSQVRLICNVGEDLFESVISHLRRFPNVDTSGIGKVEGNHFHCYILFASEYGTQYDEGADIPIRFSQVKPFLGDTDFVLVSPMTGFDLDLRTLRDIKQAAKCPLYFDYHILSLDRDTLGNRYLNRRRNWLEWCSNCDHLQLNRFEAEILFSSPLSSEAAMIRFSEPILNKGVKSVAVTLGDQGVFVAWQNRKMRTHAVRLEATPISKVVDTTGCGDVFASGFIVHFLRTHDLLESYEFANKAAGSKCTFSGLDGFVPYSQSTPMSV